jgi:hypothetical protein
LFQKTQRHIISDQPAEELDKRREHGRRAIGSGRRAMAGRGVTQTVQAVHRPGARSHRVEYGMTALCLGRGQRAREEGATSIGTDPTG